MTRRLLTIVGITALAVSVATAQQVTAATSARNAIQSADPSSPAYKKISISFENMALVDALKSVERQSGATLVYLRENLPSRTRVTLKLSDARAIDVVKSLLRETALSASVAPSGNITIGPKPAGATREQGTIAGKVTDARTGKAIAGANVSVADIRSVLTDESGFYRLSGIGVGQQMVTVRLVGYAKQTRSVVVESGAAVTADFVLQQSASVLDQVVVTGTVVATELKAVPSAITVVTAKQIEERGITKIDQLFRGDVPGLFALNQGSGIFSVLDEVTMYSRGATALANSSVPSSFTNAIKTYVDGVELADAKYLSQIDPRSIERIEILTGPQASTIYGSNAINGVMQIFTKRGAAPRPQATVSLMSGVVENNFSSARTPQHDHSAQLSGVEGRFSYNAGGSWSYVGPWTPAKQSTRMGGFGGARLELPASIGTVTSDLTLRRSVMKNRVRGSSGQTVTRYRELGLYTAVFSGLSQPITHTFNGQTFGATLGYAPASWWSHELGAGQDVADTERLRTGRGFISVSDSTLGITQTHTERRSLRYSTVLRFPLTQHANAVVTAGADNWKNLTSSWEVAPQSLVGTLTGTTQMSRKPNHNAGGFMQAQLSFRDQLFFTYGLRAEWNPDYGDDAQPNYAPRYGLAYTKEFPAVTAKLRGSYGRSTRPPQSSLKTGQTISEALSGLTFLLPGILPYYGNFDSRMANPELGPEYQQGGEAGLELYFGGRGSLVITRYNQTVDGLISLTGQVDSARSTIPCPTTGCTADSRDADGYGYIWQSEYLNVASIRNQGWELQGSLNLGPFTTRGTYSWTKSRAIGADPRYRFFFTARDYPQFQPGATFKFLPEHTWALGITYARAASSVGLHLTGTGQAMNNQDDFYLHNLLSNIRLTQDRLNLGASTSGYVSFNSGYALADLVASHRFTQRVEGVLQLQNMTDQYKNDHDAQYASLGRQFKTGFRIKM